MNVKLSLRMPCCGNILIHGDCTRQEKYRAAEDGHIV
jgi:hypothetical protein